MDLIRKILKEEINEYFKGVSFDNIGETQKNMQIVYQLAFSDRLKGIFSNGFSREFAATAGGNYYCTGLYTTFDLDSTIENSRSKSSIYGDAIVKMGIESYDRFFIGNKKIAKQVYGNKYSFEDQLEYLLGDNKELYYRVKNSPYYQYIVQTESKRTAQNVAYLLRALGGMHCLADDNLNKLNIRGFVFYGSNDGNVAIIRDFKGIIPLAYSQDHGRTWKDDLFNEDTIEHTAKDYDPIIFLGNDAEKYIHPKRFRMINGYMKVQRKEDSKYNFIDENHNILSPKWFKRASDMGSNGKALVILESEKYGEIKGYASKDGIYYEENDDEPYLTYDDIKKL